MPSAKPKGRRNLVSLVGLFIVISIALNQYKYTRLIGGVDIAAETRGHNDENDNDDKSNAETHHQGPIKGLRLAMMGDSMMRYQYLSLAYYLRYGEWFDPTMRENHLTNGKGFPSWNDFFNHTNTLLAPLEYCDCYRNEDVVGFENTVENRYFYNPHEDDNSLVFITAFGTSHPVHGRLLPEQVAEKRRHPKPYVCASPLRAHNSSSSSSSKKNATTTTFVWEVADWTWVLRNHVALLDPRPTHVVLNAGWWGSDYHLAAHKRQRRELVQTIQDKLNMTFLWRKTTASRDHRIPNRKRGADQYICRENPPNSCIDTAWTKQIKDELYWDHIHMYEPVYRSLNEDLLERIGYHVTNRMDRAALISTQNNNN